MSGVAPSHRGQPSLARAPWNEQVPSCCWLLCFQVGLCARDSPSLSCCCCRCCLVAGTLLLLFGKRRTEGSIPRGVRGLGCAPPTSPVDLDQRSDDPRMLSKQKALVWASKYERVTVRALDARDPGIKLEDSLGIDCGHRAPKAAPQPAAGGSFREGP